MKISRNAPCVCGSKLKYKNCCLNKKKTINSDQNLPKTHELIYKAGLLSIEQDKKSIESAIKILNDVISDNTISTQDKKSAKLALATAYQHIGDHKKAITVLESLEEYYDGKNQFSMALLYMLAISFCSLGHFKESSEMFDTILLNWKIKKAKKPEERKSRGFYLIEAGKSYKSNGNIEKAEKCWKQSIKYLQEFSKTEAEHLERAKANLAFIRLNDPDEDIQKLGVAKLEQSIDFKLKIGDIQGAANNFCNLGNYFRSKSRYGRAIAYYRKDLYISRLIGNKRDIASTLGNFATLYADLKQFTLGRSMLREAHTIAEELCDEHLLQITKQQLSYLNNNAKTSGINGLNIGDKAQCACESDKLYINCCGLADFEPVGIPAIYGGISEDVESIHNEIQASGKTISPLDFILRQTPKSQLRKSWSEHGFHDGWVSVKEIPDMANLHIISAREMAKKSSENNDISSVLSAVILSICHLEAFINQLSFFIFDNKEHPEVTDLIIPTKLLDEEAYGYQRTTNLESKWLVLSECINGHGWLESQPEWKETKDLIYIRNELVHFKTNGYEQVVPPPKKMDVIYSKVPNSVTMRDEPHSWPFKILTEGLATWAVDTSERLVDKLKLTYNSNRRRNTA